MSCQLAEYEERPRSVWTPHVGATLGDGVRHLSPRYPQACATSLNIPVLRNVTTSTGGLRVGTVGPSLSGEQICARTIRALRDIGADKVYVSNLGFRRVEQRYRFRKTGIELNRERSNG